MGGETRSFAASRSLEPVGALRAVCVRAVVLVVNMLDDIFQGLESSHNLVDEGDAVGNKNEVRVGGPKTPDLVVESYGFFDALRPRWIPSFDGLVADGSALKKNNGVVSISFPL